VSMPSRFGSKPWPRVSTAHLEQTAPTSYIGVDGICPARAVRTSLRL
jgi:hypothetical protein